MREISVAFDMDGLLFDTERLAIDSWLWAGRQVGIGIDRDIVLLTLGLDRGDTRRVFEEHYGTANDYDRIRALRIEYTKTSIERDGMPVKPGLGVLLDWLETHGVRFALATSTDRDRAGYYLDRAGLSARFVYRVCGDMVANGKPAPDIYLAAARLLGAQPGCCFALEDAPLGILAAHRAGCLPVMIPDLVEPDAATEALLYARRASLADVVPLLEDALRA